VPIYRYRINQLKSIKNQQINNLITKQLIKMETTRVISVGSKFPQFNKQAVVSTEQGKEYGLHISSIFLSAIVLRNFRK
jgi:hypothetical protein